MERCSCYHFYQGAGVFYSDGVCYGTKEREPCSCGGDPAKCDFYPEKRKAAICDLYDTQSKQCEPYKPCICPYDGDTSKCTFAETESVTIKVAELDRPNKNGVVIPMNTAEMWLAAQKDCKTYFCNNIRYSLDRGFFRRDGLPACLKDLSVSFDEFMNHQWRQGVTRAEAEKTLGCVIID